jgi:colicin import membrane protein
MNAQTKHLEFAPPPPAGTGRSLGASLFVHFLLMVALTAGIQWKQDNSLSVEAELWSAVPQAAAPKPVDVEPPPAPPPPPPAPKQAAIKPPPPAPDREAEIALAKRRKQLDDEKKLQEQKEADRRKKEELKKAEDKKAKLKAEEEKRKLDAKREEEERKLKERHDKERKDKEAKKLQEQKDAKQAADDAKKLDAIRKENMKRIAGLAGATGDENATGTAQRASGPSDNYGGRIRAKIKPNITFTEDVVGNSPAEVEVRCAPDGTIVGRKLVKSSGNAAWDNAVLKAIDKTEVLPRDTDGRVHSPLIISFRPKD